MWLKGLRRMVTICAWTGDSDVMRPLKGLLSLTPGSIQAHLTSDDTTENGWIIRMFSNDHLRRSWWCNYSVSALVFASAVLLSSYVRLVRQSCDLNSLWQLSGRVERESRHASQTWETQRFSHVFHCKNNTNTSFAAKNSGVYGHTCCPRYNLGQIKAQVCVCLLH